MLTKREAIEAMMQGYFIRKAHWKVKPFIKYSDEQGAFVDDVGNLFDINYGNDADWLIADPAEYPARVQRVAA